MKRFTLVSSVVLMAVAGLAIAAGPEAKPTAPAAPSAPATSGDLIEVLKSHKKYSTLVKAIEAAGLTDALKQPGPFTIFAPTNEAFAKLPKAQIEGYFDPSGASALKDLLKAHVIPAKIPSTELAKMKETSKSLQGATFLVIASGKQVSVGTEPGRMANIAEPDMAASNGVIHGIDQVCTRSQRDNSINRGPNQPE